ncbi:MAG: response regulator [Magnetococcales bacterium]|nr:response regulator [Magnetococcales bacterium]
MSDLLFESISLAVVLITFLLLLKSGRAMELNHQGGWSLIIAGFTFLVFGSILDILDEFAPFKFLDFWEEMAGTLPGYILLALGFYRWFPEITKLKKAEEKLRRANHSLARQVQQRKLAMEDLANAKDQAEKANQSKDAFLATMSHEIRTPINIILGMQELLKDAELSSKYREYLHLSITAGKRLLFLINDLLDFAQIDQGKFTLDHRDFDLRKLMDEVTMILAPLASAKGVELTAHIPAHLPTHFQGDPNRLGQIFTNLLTNAIKFTPAGGCVDLHGGPIGHHDDEKLEFLFEVRDTGSGIPAEKREVIFNRFTQADNSPSRAHEGTGLGLAITKYLVLLMEGEIGVDDNLHAPTGSTFFFSITLQKQSGNYLDTAITSTPLTGYSIRLFDCEGLQLTMLTDHLERWGSRVLRNDEEAPLDPDENQKIVIVNHKPGSHDDFLPLQHLTADSRLLILTDLLDQAWDQAATYVGSISCLQKPVSSERLLNAILNAQSDESIHANNDQEERLSPVGSVLVVDDQTTNLLLTKALLEKIGFTEDAIDLADSGKKALSLVIDNPYQLILLDLRMPNMDGYQTARAIRAAQLEKRGQPIPIVAFSGDITKKSKKKCLQAKMDGLLAKPASLSDLKRVIKKYFSYTSHDLDEKQQESSPGTSTLTAALDAMGLPPENHGEVAEVLIEQLPSLMKGLEQAIIDREEEKARATAHVLKGSMANVLFPTLKDPSVRVHQSIRNKEWMLARKELENYRAILNPIMHSIQTYLTTTKQQKSDG